MNDSKPPNRAHCFELRLNADSVEALVESLRQIALDIEMDGLPSPNCGSGAPRAGYTYTYTHNPAMTHEAYIAALNQWIGNSRG